MDQSPVVTSFAGGGAIARVAEIRIQEAIEAGLFDNLPGEGKPIPDLELQVPGQEMVAWVRDWIRRENLRNDQLKRPSGH